MQTYISVMISSEGGLASEITEKLQELGFKTTLGGHDFVYKWDKRDIAPVEVINFVDKIQRKLQGMNVRFSLTTIK